MYPGKWPGRYPILLLGSPPSGRLNALRNKKTEINNKINLYGLLNTRLSRIYDIAMIIVLIKNQFPCQVLATLEADNL